MLPQCLLSIDGWFWIGDKLGLYIVKECYKRIHDQENLKITRDGLVWKKIWQIKAPPKMINLLWRAVTDCLPTKSRLVQKQIVDSGVCPLCCTSEESVLHTMVSYVAAKHVWGIFGVGWFFGNVSNFTKWLEMMFEKVDKGNQGMIVVICWGLWKNRN